MNNDREYELLARIEQLKDQLESARTTILEREREIEHLHKTIETGYEPRDRLRATQSQGAV